MTDHARTTSSHATDSTGRGPRRLRLLALAGASYASVPAAGAKGRKRTTFFVDQAAASQVPPELIDQEY